MLLSIITFILVLSVLVLAHEFGHFIAARKNGVWVEEFGIGYPPRVWGKKVGETLYSVNLLPLGGFVRLHGEQSEEGVTKPDRAFVNKSKKVRFIILASGVLMNFLLSVVCFSVFYSFSGVPRKGNEVIISGVVEDAPADKAGIIPGDVVLSVDGIVLDDLDKFTSLVKERKGQKVALQVRSASGDMTRSVDVTPRTDVPEDEGPLGVMITDTKIYFPPLWQRPFLGVYHGFEDAIFWGKQVITGLASMAAGLVRGEVPKDIAGPVGIYAITTEVAKIGILPLINFVGIFSVNLAVINFLPIPALDGGRFLFIVIERIFGRKVLPRIEAVIHSAGMIVLLSLFAVLTIIELKRLILAGSLQAFLENSVK